MDFKEKIIKFVKAKNDIIKLNCDVEYITNEDIEDIRKWSKFDCEWTYGQIVSAVYSLNASGLSETTCPWCINLLDIPYDKCEECGYGIRHGICTKKGSLYRSYNLKSVKDALTNKSYNRILKQLIH